MFKIYLNRKEIRVCSYTLGLTGNESGEKEVCNVQLLDGVRGEMWWVYTYISYNRQTKTLFALLRVEGKNYVFKRTALHMKLGYLGLFWLKDPTRAGFRGTAKNFFLSVGNKSNTDEEEAALAFGGESPEPKEGDIDYDALSTKGKTFGLRVTDKEPNFRADLPPTLARAASEFRLEFWSKISLTDPERTVDGKWLKDGCRQIARAYEGLYTSDTENKKKDRFLTVFYCAGASYQYKFYTYYENVAEEDDLNGYSINAEFSELEGQWNYIYVGYDSKLNGVYAGVYFSATDRLATVRIAAARARGKPNKIGWLFGAGFGWGTINGVIEKAAFRWDDDAYLSNADQILQNLDGENEAPPASLPLKLRWRLIGDGEDLATTEIFPIPVEELEALDAEEEGEDGEQAAETTDSAAAEEAEGEEDGEQEAYFDGEQEEPIFRDMREENSGADEWAFFGWFKFIEPKRMPQIPVSVLRAVFNKNENNELNLASNFGDQVVGLYIAQGNLEFCTGNTGEAIIDKVNPRECVSSPYGNDLGEWIWFYMGYSRKEQKTRVFVRYDDHNWETSSDDIIHILPHWSGVYLGSDPFLTPFKGYMRNFEAYFGPHSFITGSLDYLIEASPPLEVRQAMLRAFGDDLAFILVESRAKTTEYVYKLEIPPNLLDDVFSVSYSFWFRLSTQTPEKLIDMSFLQDRNNPIILARAFDCEISDYDGQEKERFLAVWIENGRIVFGGFDETDQEVKTADGEMPFSELEGSWNWVYIGLNLQSGTVTGAQYNLDSGIWEFVSIPEVRKEDPLPYLKFITGQSFGIDTINGHFYDVRFDFEENTLLESPKAIRRFFEKVIPTPTAFRGSEEIISIEAVKDLEFFEHPSPRADIKNVNSQTQVEPGTYRAIDMTPELKSNTEYAIYGWFKFVEPQIRREGHMVFRLTNNIPNGNFEYEGDSTIMLLITQDNLEFSTYNIADEIGGKNHPREVL